MNGKAHRKLSCTIKQIKGVRVAFQPFNQSI